MTDFYVFHIQYLVVLIWLKTVLLAIIFQEINKLRQSQQSAPILINNQIYSTINCYCSCIHYVFLCIKIAIIIGGLLDLHTLFFARSMQFSGTK